MKQHMQRISLYGVMIRRYSKMFAGNSYWHRDQDVGKYFTPGELLGYYNDLSGKILWDGPVDSAGLPLNRTANGQRVRHPITLFNKALGHWDCWLGSERQDEKHRAVFLQLARWTLDSQDEYGGWECWKPLGLKRSNSYSAMAQGESMSVLVRAFVATEDEVYVAGARRALRLLLTSVEKGGTSWLSREGLILEEFPYQPPRTVLNGWIYASYGLYDLALVDDSPEVRETLESTLSALVTRLRDYDAGFWSYYDTSGALASPFYHRLHIAQLKALELTYPKHVASFRTLRETFERQVASRSKRTRAVALKSYQKLINPPEAITP